MHYFRSYGFAFKSPQWAMNLLFAVVCLLIPVVGQIVLIGYLFEVIEYTHRRGSDDAYPDFDFGRFVKYLLRGVWPFLADLLISMILVPVLGGGYIVIVFMWIFVAEKNFSAEIATVTTIAIATIALMLIIVTTLARIPVYLKAGLQQEFGPAFSLSFFRSFYGRVGGSVILTVLFELFTAPFVSLAGLLLCVIGVYPAAAVLAFSQHHLLYQLYQQYLKEGGMPIPLKPEDLPVKVDYGEEIVEDPKEYPE